MGVGVLGLIVEEVNDEGLLFNEYCNKYIFRANLHFDYMICQIIKF